MSEGGRLLILVVDRDGDLEVKTRARTPLVGRDAVASAATQLAISDPEEADANALFAAVKQHDMLKKEGERCEVAAVCGIRENSLESDRKVRREVEKVVREGRYTGILLVSDGAEDEQVIPILQSIRPIVSVVRIVVKHSRTVEETYMVLGRYLRMLVYDPRYSKWFIGVPGVILLFAGVLVLLGRAYEAGIGILLIMGSAFLVRGFSLDRSVAKMLTQRPYGYLRLFSILASILIFIVGLSSGYTYMADEVPDILVQVADNPGLFLVHGNVMIGYYLQGALPLIWAAFAVYFVGAMLARLVRGSRRAWRDGVMLVLLGLLYLPMDQFAAFLTGGERSSILLVSYVLLGLAAIFGVVAGLYRYVRNRPPLMKSEPSA